MTDLSPLARAVAALPAENQLEWADCYWTAYAKLVSAKSPAFQQRLMKLLADGADLQAASEIFHAAFPPSTGYSFQMTPARGALPALAWSLNRDMRQMTGPHRATSSGHAVLLCTVHLVSVLRNEGTIFGFAG